MTYRPSNTRGVPDYKYPQNTSPALRLNEGHKLAEFYSATTAIRSRFCGPLLPRVLQYKLQKEAVDSVLSLASAAQPTNPLVPSDNEIQTERLSGYIAGRIYLDELVREDATYASIEFLEKHKSKWSASLGVCRALLMSLPTS